MGTKEEQEATTTRSQSKDVRLEVGLTDKGPSDWILSLVTYKKLTVHCLNPWTYGVQ